MGRFQRRKALSQLLAAGAGHRCHLGEPNIRAPQGAFFVSRRRRHGAERPGRVPGLPPQLQAEIARDEAGADVAAAARVCASCWARKGHAGRSWPAVICAGSCLISLIKSKGRP